MEKRRLGPLQVEPLAFGAWAAGGKGWGEVRDDEILDALKAWLDSGMSLIDTAPVYGLGHSEELVGQAIGGRDRDRVVIATKCALSWDDKAKVYGDASPKAVREGLIASLRRLRVEYVDLLQVHWPDANVEVEQTAEELGRLLDEGLVRAIGVSNYDEQQIERHRQVAPLHTLQPPYSIARPDRERLEELLAYCAANDVGTLVYSPLQKGLLTGKYRGSETYPEGDVRRNDKSFQGERFRRMVELTEAIREVADRHDRTVAQTVLAYTLGVPGVTVAIVGAKNPRQVEENLGALGWTLPDDDRALIHSLVEEHNPGPAHEDRAGG